MESEKWYTVFYVDVFVHVSSLALFYLFIYLFLFFFFYFFAAKCDYAQLTVMHNSFNIYKISWWETLTAAWEFKNLACGANEDRSVGTSVQSLQSLRFLIELPCIPSRKHAYIILTPLNPTFI